MSYFETLEQVRRKGRNTFWYMLAQAAWIQADGSEHDSHVFANAYATGAVAASTLDDVQDQDGYKSLWQQVGIGAAVNIGVSLSFEVFHLLSELQLSPNAQNLLMRYYSETVQKMCVGQHLDLTASCDLTLDAAWNSIAHKTGSWCAFGTAAYAYAISSPATPLLQEVGWHIGCWHQIGNDLNSILHEDGKGDLCHRRPTVLTAYAFTVAQAEQRDLLQHLWHNTNAPEAVDRLKQLLLQLGVSRYAEIMGQYHLQEAHRRLQQLNMTMPLPPSLESTAYRWAVTDEIVGA